MNRLIRGHLINHFDVPEEKAYCLSRSKEEEWWDRASSLAEYTRLSHILPFLQYSFIPLDDPIHVVISLFKRKRDALQAHIAGCKDKECSVEHCVVCRRTLSHLIMCTCETCGICSLMDYCVGKALTRAREGLLKKKAAQGLMRLIEMG